MEQPFSAVLTHRIPVETFGGSIKCADLDGDGEQELLLLQAGGQMGVKRGSSGSEFINDADRTLHCLTAMKLDGTVLWQRGEPWADPANPFVSHGAGDMMMPVDLDNDGRVEVVVVQGDQLLVLEGRDGSERACTTLPADNFLRLTSAQLGNPRDGLQIICKVNDAAYPPWDYANPIVVYNADLSIHREPFAVRGAGHNVVVMDLDGDGRDELFIGYSYLDHDLREVWRLDLGPDYNYAQEHADQITVCDVNGDGHLEVCYAGSEDFFVTDLDGKTVWSVHAGHSQYAVMGPWGPKGEQRVVMSEKNLGIWGFDGDGKLLWNRKDLNGYARRGPHWNGNRGQRDWPVFRPQLRPPGTREDGNIVHGDFKPYTSDPAWSRGLWPHFLNADGKKLEVFPWKDDYAMPPRKIRAARSYDCGLLYDILVIDLDGDGLDEALIYNRDQVWAFHCGDAVAN